jgi:hypothetical protein
MRPPVPLVFKRTAICWNLSGALFINVFLLLVPFLGPVNV